jgi:hypothetical protein
MANGPFSAASNGQPSTGAGGKTDVGQSNTDLLKIIKDCPEVIKCMQSCTNGYNLDTLPSHGCPLCTCADNTGSGPGKGNIIQEMGRFRFI